MSEWTHFTEVWSLYSVSPINTLVANICVIFKYVYILNVGQLIVNSNLTYLFSLCSGYLVHQPIFTTQNKVVSVCLLHYLYWNLSTVTFVSSIKFNHSDNLHVKRDPGWLYLASGGDISHRDVKGISVLHGDSLILLMSSELNFTLIQAHKHWLQVAWHIRVMVNRDEQQQLHCWLLQAWHFFTSCYNI